MKNTTIALLLLATLTGTSAFASQNQIDTTQDSLIEANGADINALHKRVQSESNSQGNLNTILGEGMNEAHERIDAQRGQINANTGRVIANRAEINSNTADIEKNTKRIDGLESAMKQQGDEMRERYDGVKASMHAITNARPVAYDVGEFAVGAGIGAAGSKQALAIGGAYRFNKSWSGSFTTNYETEGKQTKADLSAGVGVHYSFK